MSKRQILSKALALKREGKLYDTPNSSYDETFSGSIDRFCEIAYRLQNSKKVLDVGAGNSLLLALLSELGHECYALDITDPPDMVQDIHSKKNIRFRKCNVEIDALPFPNSLFDAVVCCQALEHFTHSHLHTMKEIHRVLKAGGIVEIDVPNAVCFRNRSRMLRGKHITWDYRKHYLYAKPIVYKGLSFYPDRHNRDFTKDEVQLLLEESGFKHIEVFFLKSRRHREGLRKIKSLGSGLRDAIPSLRKSIMAFGEK